MKILYVSGSVFPSNASHTLSKMRMCQAFFDDGHDVVLSAVKNRSDENEGEILDYYGLRGGFRFVLKKSSSLWDNAVARKILFRGVVIGWFNRNISASFQPDIAYSRLTLAELLFLPRELPIVYETHSLGPLGGGNIRKEFFFWLTRRKNFRRIIVTTHALAKLMRDKLPNTEIVVAPLSAELPVQIDSATLSNFRAQHFQGGVFKYHVGYTGNLDTVGLRGTEVICKCAAKLPEIAFHVVGGDPDSLHHWQSFAARENPNGNLFFYGRRNPAEMPFFLKNFDVVMAPLQWRPTQRAPIGAGMSPLKLAQYMAYGKTIVASDIPAHRELMCNYKTAIMVECDDINAWVKAINQLISDPEKRVKMGMLAYNDYLATFTPESRVKKILTGIT